MAALQVGVHHQRVAQTIALGIQKHLMMGTEALFIYLNADFGFHDGSAQAAVHIDELNFAPERAQRAGKGLFEGVPYRDSIQMIAHGGSFSPAKRGMFDKGEAYIVWNDLRGGANMGIQTGYVRVKRYKARRRRRACLLLLGLLVCIPAGLWIKDNMPKVRDMILQPMPTLTPEESAHNDMDYALAGKTWYALQLGIFEQKDAADALAQSYRLRGAGGYVQKTGQGYRVLAAAYDLRTDAVTVQSNLEKNHQVETFVTEIAYPGIVMHFSGQQGQLDALSASYDFIAQAADELMSLSMQWDEGKIARQDLLTALDSHRQTAEALRGQLIRYFGNREDTHAAAAALQELLEELQGILQRALTEEGSALLGARIKEGQLCCLCRLQEHAAQLEAAFSSR